MAASTNPAAGASLRPIRWHFDDSPLWDGLDQGTHWNGWSNISITPEVRDAAALWLDTVDDPDSVASWRSLQAGPDGLIDLSGGYTPNVDEEATACAALGRALEFLTGVVVSLSARFVARLKETLTADQWSEMLRRNAEAWDSPFDTCASHDFCDSNMVMAAAFEDVVGHEPHGSFETHFDPATQRHVADDPAEEARAYANMWLWNEAWCIAKGEHLMDTALADRLEAEDLAAWAARGW